MRQDSLSATPFTKGAYPDRSELGEFAVRKYFDRACGPPTERTLLCQPTGPEFDKLPEKFLSASPWPLAKILLVSNEQRLSGFDYITVTDSK
jgi:hypothetical protein